MLALVLGMGYIYGFNIYSITWLRLMPILNYVMFYFQYIIKCAFKMVNEKSAVRRLSEGSRSGDEGLL